MPYGAGADLVAADLEGVFPLPDELTLEQGAAMPMNYLTAEFALSTRAGLAAGETVLVHGAAGGVGTASIQVAKGLGARVVAVASSEEKRHLALTRGGRRGGRGRRLPRRGQAAHRRAGRGRGGRRRGG